MSDQFNIDPTKNYKRLSNGDVFTGQQVLSLLDIAGLDMQAVILLDIVPTDESPTRPDSKYGTPQE